VPGAKDHPPPKFFTAYSFGIVTLGLFLLSWVGQLVFQLMEARNDSAQHGEPFAGCRIARVALSRP
jgi:hypothetical protein